MTSHIDNRLDMYGRPECPICGQPQDRGYRDDVSKESIFAGERYQLTCRNHPGHPLYVDAAELINAGGI